MVKRDLETIRTFWGLVWTFKHEKKRVFGQFNASFGQLLTSFGYLKISFGQLFQNFGQLR